MAKDRVVATVEKCPRCGARHERMALKAFEPAPASGGKWFGQCPDTHQPITADVELVVKAY